MLAAVLLFTLLSVLPAAGIFKFTWNHELGTLLNYQAKHVARQKSDLNLAIKDQARKSFAKVYGPDWADVTKEAVKAKTDAVWGDPPPGYQPGAASSDPLAWWKPVYNDASAMLRYEQSASGLVEAQGLSMTPGPFALLGGVLLLGALVFLIRYQGKHLLLSDFTDRPPVNLLKDVEAARETGQDLLIVASSQSQLDEVRLLVTNPGQQTGVPVGRTAQAVSTAPDHATVFELTEAFHTPESRLQGLSSLEQIAAAGKAIVLSRIDPLAVIFGHSSEPAEGSAQTGLTESERRRWSDVLARFTIILAPLRAGALPENTVSAEPFYWSLWNSCNDTEKLVLVHVAEEGFANPWQTDIAERLLRRGLLVLDPDLRPFTPAFRQFIRKVYEADRVTEWEQPTHGLGWTNTRWILVIMLTTVVVFLFGTQRQALSQLVAFVSALTGAFTGILKLISDVTPKSRAQ
jgi:hypothetical protein